ncbi:MAG: DUF2793 domain-containing protein [Sphingomicrobium sp.]
MSGTPRLGLPFLSAGQAQKEIFHNEALQTLDLLIAGAVEEAARADPPASPAPGDCYIVGANPTGEWAGKQDCLAGFTTSGWRLIPPRDGMTVFVRSIAVWAVYRAGGWELGPVRGSGLLIGGQQVVGGRASAIPSAAGGSTIDTEARAAIDQILTAMRQHGLIEP